MSNYSFKTAPVIRSARSKFNLSRGWTASADMGRLIPMFIQEILPGDSLKVDTTGIFRLSSAFQKPMFGTLFADFYYFFVPNRLAFADSEKVFGNPMPSQYQNTNLSRYPFIEGRTTNISIYQDTIADYLGLPLMGKGIAGGTADERAPCDINVIPFRDIALIWNTWYRDENVQDEVLVHKNARTTSEIFNNNEWSASNYFGKCPPVAKVHDYFTSCLPNSQKGRAIDFPVTVSGGNFLPLDTAPFGSGEVNTFQDYARFGGQGFSGNNNWILGLSNDGENLGAFSVVDSAGTDVPPLPSYGITESNLGVNVPGLGASVNDMRMAFQAQRLLERLARGGSRYNEYVLSAFGVSTPDSRVQLPEYLGGRRVPINVQQVTNQGTNLAELGAYSLSGGSAKFNKAFVEHGFVFGFVAIRQKHQYQQGVDRFWTRTKRFDYYDPVFANIAEQPVWRSELYFRDTYDQKGERIPFGYQEAWADYRYGVSHICGQLRSDAVDSLEVWQMADDYANAPVLGSEFVSETPTYLDRVMVSPTQDQFLIDLWHNVTAIRVMPTYSIPGLIDHH